MKRSLRSLFITLLIFLSISSCAFASTTVNLIATNDMHGVLEASDSAVGVAQVSAIKNSTENALLIDSGDATQGTTLATINEGNDIIKLMNAAGYDCMVAGNHEFDYGSEQLLKNAKTANFPIISANAVTSSGTLLPSTFIATEAGKKIGFVGITTTITNTATNPALRPGVTFSNEIEAAKKAIASLKGKVDTIVLLTHLGDNPDVVPVTSGQLLDGLDTSELSQVSAVLDGHSHTIESKPYVRGNYSIPVIQDQTQLTHVGKVAITFNDNGSVTAKEQVMDYDAANNYSVNSAGQTAKDNTQSVIDTVNKEQSTITSRVIGNTSTPLWGGYIYWDYAEPRIVETNFGDLVSDAYKDAAQSYASRNGLKGTVLGVVNGGGIGNSINPGEITYGEVLNVFNHGNMAVVIQTTPAELYQVLEDGLRTTGQNSNGMLERTDVSGSFIQCSGFKYSYNPSGATGSKITSVQTNNGTTLSRTDNTTPLIIGTQNYVQTFFKNSKQLVMLDGEDTTISNYISKQKGLNYPTNGNRISVSNDTSPETYTVKIPVYDGTEGNLAQANTSLRLSIDNGAYESVQTDSSSNLNLTLSKGPHTLILEECNKPVYVNNYSGAGTSFTKPGYYGLSFIINEVTNTPATDIDLDPHVIYLVPEGAEGTTSAEITATLTPENVDSSQITWTVEPGELTLSNETGPTNTISSTEVPGTYTVIASIKGYNDEEIIGAATVIVSDEPIVADPLQTSISADSPDFYTVTVTPTYNPALEVTPTDREIEKVSIFTWSQVGQTDLDCKVANNNGNGTFSYTFPVNNTPVNEYYLDASAIVVQAYASYDASNDGNMVLNLSWNYSNINWTTGVIATPYVANTGFITPSVGNDAIAGTVGQATQMEGLRLSTPVEGVDIVYDVHVQNIGWMDEVYEGVYAGTMHNDLQMEACHIRLTGPNASNYSIQYQAHIQDIGWQNWVQDGAEAGTTGRGLAMEAIRLQLVPAGTALPTS